MDNERAEMGGQLASTGMAESSQPNLLMAMGCVQITSYNNAAIMNKNEHIQGAVGIKQANLQVILRKNLQCLTHV